MRRIRIGIDVGGTFTHAVAVDAQEFVLVAQTKTPTTHRGKTGVARGLVTVLGKLLQKGDIAPDEIILVAHSTTQATNALLEGDVAKVGIVGMGTGLKNVRIRRETNVQDIELAPGKLLPTCYRYLDVQKNFSKEAIGRALQELKGEGAGAIAAAEAFSVDNPEREKMVVAMSEEMGLPATASHQLSQLYGLRIRTRTAVINASMLPVMIATAKMTEECLRDLGITAPLMIMRSDGGVMDVQGMKERPILTMLSGPAAGVAAALMYARVSEGIFLEVGGTSTDICAIHHGEVAARTARIGKHKLHVKTLDVRTVGVAGGSLPRIKDGEIFDVGPRSAHIAGMPYESFTYLSELDLAEPTSGAPKPNDPSDYIFLQNRDKNFAITITGAANQLGMVPQHDYARGGEKNVNLAFTKLAAVLHSSADKVAEDILNKGCNKVATVVHELVEDYGLDYEKLRLYGGGGGASTVVPYTARLLNLKFSLTTNNAVISAIGVALAMVRETIERSIVNPTDDDLLQIRQEAEAAITGMGASPESVEVKIEIDAGKQSVRAIAIGSTEPRMLERIGGAVSVLQRADIAASALEADERNLETLADTGFFSVYSVQKIIPRLFGLLKIRVRPLVVLDQRGVVRLSFRQARLLETKVDGSKEELRRFLEINTHYGDMGAQIPNMHLAVGPRLFDFSGLATASQVVTMGSHELSRFTAETPVLLLAETKN